MRAAKKSDDDRVLRAEPLRDSTDYEYSSRRWHCSSVEQHGRDESWASDDVVPSSASGAGLYLGYISRRRALNIYSRDTPRYVSDTCVSSGAWRGATSSSTRPSDAHSSAAPQPRRARAPVVLCGITLTAIRLFHPIFGLIICNRRAEEPIAIRPFHHTFIP